MKEFLKRKDIVFSFERYGIEALRLMAMGLFASLITGLILKEFGGLLYGVWAIEPFLFLQSVGGKAIGLTGAAIAIAIAVGFKAPLLVILSSAVCGLAGYEAGGPVGAFVGGLVATEVGKMISQETKLDLLVTPIVTMLVGVLMGQVVGVPLNNLMVGLGEFIMWATALQPFLMGIVLAVVMGIILTLPISSAALCVMLGLSGLAAGAAVAGCAAQMVGFAVASYKENKMEGLVTQGIGTSMIQIPNIMKNPKIWIPAIVASAIVGPLSTVVFKMVNTPTGAGMGTAGFVGQIQALSAMGYTMQTFLAIALVHFLIPALVAYGVSEILRKKGWIQDGDMKLKVN